MIILIIIQFNLMKKNAANIQDCTVVEMHDRYPYGQLKQASHGEQTVLVRKKLVYQNSSQLQIIKKMVQFLSSLDSQYLVQLVTSKNVEDDHFFFYYQYVPLTLEKWILDLGDDILEELQFEMLTLANYLAQHNIKFRFDPHCLGLSKEIKVKYFLHEFSIDSEKKIANFKESQEEIVRFFHQFRLKYQKFEEIAQNYADRKSADSALLLNRLEMLQKRESWNGKQKGLTSQKSKKNFMLSEKIQNSKKKSMQIIERLKHLKPHHQ